MLDIERLDWCRKARGRGALGLLRRPLLLRLLRLLRLLLLLLMRVSRRICSRYGLWGFLGG